MKLNEYLQKEIDKLVLELIARAPVDVCPQCCDNDTHLTYDGKNFWYECARCKVRWPSDVLDLDPDGKFSVLEWAD